MCTGIRDVSDSECDLLHTFMNSSALLLSLMAFLHCSCTIGICYLFDYHSITSC